MYQASSFFKIEYYKGKLFVPRTKKFCKFERGKSKVWEGLVVAAKSTNKLVPCFFAINCT